MSGDIFYLYFRKTFDSVSPKILVDNLTKYGLDKWTTKRIKNWMNNQVQRVVISDIRSSWKPVTSAIPQGSTKLIN